MDDIRQAALDRFRAYLERRQFSAHTIVSYTLDLHVFFTTVTVPSPKCRFARWTTLWSTSISRAARGQRSTVGSMR